MPTNLFDDIAGVTESLAALQTSPSPALLSAVQNLLNVCEHVLQQSLLLRLPPEMLLTVLRELDAKSLAKLGATMRAFPLLERACNEAAEFQHGRELAALRPQHLSAPRRLHALEEAIEHGSGWGHQSAYYVRNRNKFLWPSCTCFNEDVGKHHLAVLMSASANGSVKRMAEHDDTRTGPDEVDRVHKSAINLAAQLAADDVASGCGIAPMARSDAVAFLAAQLGCKDKAANVNFVRQHSSISDRPQFPRALAEG